MSRVLHSKTQSSTTGRQNTEVPPGRLAEAAMHLTAAVLVDVVLR